MSPREKRTSLREEQFSLDSATLAVPEYFYTTSLIKESTALPRPYTVLSSDGQGLPSGSSTIFAPGAHHPPKQSRSHRDDGIETPHSTSSGLPLSIAQPYEFSSHDYSNYENSGVDLSSGSDPLQSEELVHSNFHSWYDSNLQASAESHALTSELFQSYDFSVLDRQVGIATTTLNRSRRQHALPPRSNKPSTSSFETSRMPHNLRPRRRGPLKKQVRQKADAMRDIGACWRCRKYKKSVSQEAPSDAISILLELF